MEDGPVVSGGAGADSRGAWAHSKGTGVYESGTKTGYSPLGRSSA